MTDVSVILPARNERFLTKTINDLVSKSRLDTEIIAVLEGYWPEEIVNHPKVHYIHFSKPRGMRGALNAGVAIAKGKFVMKLDGHCMVSEGFDKVLAETCRDNWVCFPTRHRLDPENWVVNDGDRHPINYQYINSNNDSLDGKPWNEKNRKRTLDAIRIDDLISAQGSTYFLPRDFWYELELLDEASYGTFRKDPQEVIFKAWTYGGRCVRVKDAWYAHLHKGKKYGRGYGGSKRDWLKGDEFVKKWWTDSAWSKQKIPLREIFAKFPDMPGWQDHEWMKGAETVAQTKQLPNLYQVLELPDGTPFSRPKPNRKNSRFWNEGKWQNFVEPLLPEDARDQVFVEMGCDAGLFLKLATDHGFKRVVGVEKNKTPVRHGEEYRDTIGYDYPILKRKLGGTFHEDGSFDIDELPVADYTLLSTFHYYIDINAWIKYLDRLRSKSAHVLIVSRIELEEDRWLAKASLEAVRGYFLDWQEIGMVEIEPEKDEPGERSLYSVLFRNPLFKRYPMSAIKPREKSGYYMHEAKADLAQQIAANEPFDLFATDYYKAWVNRKGQNPRWSDRTIRRFVQMKAAVMEDVRDNGLKDPILVNQRMQLCDGGHRLAMLKAMGEESVIARIV